MLSKQHAIAADEAEISYLTDRWRLLPGDQQVAGVLLEDLLSAQDRLADAELGYTSSLVAYNVALIDLKRATGTLLEFEQITPAEACCDGLPTLMLEKASAPSDPTPEAVPPPESLPQPQAAPSVVRLPRLDTSIPSAPPPRQMPVP
jgi:hypothetical protein